MMRKTLIGASIGTGMLLMAVAPAFASIDCTNDTTGALSSNYCKILAKRKANVAVFNHAYIKNRVYTTTNTGANSQDFNTQAGGNGIQTGHAVSDAGVANDVNTNDLTVDQSGCDDCTGATGSNTLTGYDSENKVYINTSKYVNLRVENAAKVKNYITTSADTGNNTQNYNTIAGNLTTGDATSTSTVVNVVNSNTVHITQ